METSTARSPYQELEGRSVAPPAGRRPLNLGGTTKRSFALVPTAGTGAFFFSPVWEFSPIRPDLWKNTAAKPATLRRFRRFAPPFGAEHGLFAPLYQQMTPGTLSGFMDLLAPAEPELLWGPRH